MATKNDGGQRSWGTGVQRRESIADRPMAGVSLKLLGGVSAVGNAGAKFPLAIIPYPLGLSCY